MESLQSMNKKTMVKVAKPRHHLVSKLVSFPKSVNQNAYWLHAHELLKFLSKAVDHVFLMKAVYVGMV